MNLNNKIDKKLFLNALKATKKGEIPVSAVIVKNNRILCDSYNQKEKKHDITAHAEILAIQKAAKKLHRWNLNDCDLYVSLKPCNMCMEVIKQSRIRKVYYFLEKPYSKLDFNKTIFELKENQDFSSSYQQLLSSFFQNKR